MAKHPPYYDTKVSEDRSRNAIRKLLYEYGAQGFDWAEVEGQLQIQFLWPMDIVDGKRRMMAYRIRPPMMHYDNGEPHPKQTLRFIYWWLKAKLEAVHYGLRSIEEEFLAEVVAHIKGPEGEDMDVTIGEIFIPQIVTGKVIEPGGLARALGLPGPGTSDNEDGD